MGPQERCSMLCPFPCSAAQNRNQPVSNGPGRTKGKQTQASVHLFHILLLGTNRVPDSAEDEVSTSQSLQCSGADSQTSRQDSGGQETQGGGGGEELREPLWRKRSGEGSELKLKPDVQRWGWLWVPRPCGQNKLVLVEQKGGHAAEAQGVGVGGERIDILGVPNVGQQ